MYLKRFSRYLSLKMKTSFSKLVLDNKKLNCFLNLTYYFTISVKKLLFLNLLSVNFPILTCTQFKTALIIRYMVYK